MEHVQELNHTYPDRFRQLGLKMHALSDLLESRTVVLRALQTAVTYSVCDAARTRPYMREAVGTMRLDVAIKVTAELTSKLERATDALRALFAPDSDAQRAELTSDERIALAHRIENAMASATRHLEKSELILELADEEIEHLRDGLVTIQMLP
jgi:hypothetical protein